VTEASRLLQRLSELVDRAGDQAEHFSTEDASFITRGIQHKIGSICELLDLVVPVLGEPPDPPPRMTPAIWSQLTPKAQRALVDTGIARATVAGNHFAGFRYRGRRDNVSDCGCA
jgi:hypothetical protein